MKTNWIYGKNRVSKIGGAFYSLLLLACGSALAATYTVKPDGTGNFTSIQACANAAQAGDTCLVDPGTYPEHVFTKSGGTDDSHRLTFKANGTATMQGFGIDHPYVTVDGFDITGYMTALAFHHISVTKGGDYCQIINNTIRDGTLGKAGIYFHLKADYTGASHCLVRGNTLRNLNYTFWNVNGTSHTFENNLLERVNSRDYIYVFGHGHVFRRNVFRDGNAIATVGNHPDWVQTFGDNGVESYNMLFEENWIENLEMQLGQLDAGGGAYGIASNIHDWIFRNNVFISVSNNMNSGLPGIRFEHNTFYRMAYTQAGIGLYGSLTRGDASRATLLNNVFVAGGLSPNVNGDIRGFYNLLGGQFTGEVLQAFVTGGNSDMALGIGIDLSVNGYLKNPNGDLTDKARTLADMSQFAMGDTGSAYRPAVYAILARIYPGNVSAQDAFYTAYMGDKVLPYKSMVYDLLILTVQLDQSIRSTTVSDFNFAAGAGPEYFPKIHSDCSEGVFSRFNFCEEHGINGGNPQFASALTHASLNCVPGSTDPSYMNDFLGPDCTPFTVDDGLKPQPTSPLCGKGQGGRDIGVYSCDPNTVLADGSPAPDFPALPPGGGWTPTPGGDTTPPPPPAGASFESFKNVFNPKVDPPLRIQFKLLNTSPVSLKIFDRRGNKVRNLWEGTVNPAVDTMEKTWDGRNEKGDIVSSGVYLLQLNARGETITKKLVVVK